jgi:glycosyltransferase involved in cell wall biosynthesis
MPGQDYMMVLPTQHFRLDDGRVALESAFAHHLRLIRSKIGASADRLVIVSPGMAAAQYQSARHSLEVLDERAESIFFDAPYSMDAVGSKLRKLGLFLPLMRKLHRLVRGSFCVHSGLSWDWILPTEFASLLFAAAHGRRTVFIVDIDYRNSARMSYKTGAWSLKSYLVCKYIYDSVRSLQVWIAVRSYSLVMLKGRKMAADFGKGRPNVKDFLDAAHSEHNIIGAEALERKLEDLRNRTSPLRLTYFGRITAYKGIDACLRAVVAARRAGALVTFDIIGGGEQAEFCRNLSRELEADEFVTFHGPMPFGAEFFNVLYQFHLLLAAPLREDTPRSALDAMAAGIPYLAYDTYYYNQLLESGAGTVVPWLDEAAMTAALIRLDADRELVASMVENAVAFARLNTQETWLDRRLEWTLKNISPTGRQF